MASKQKHKAHILVMMIFIGSVIVLRVSASKAKNSHYDMWDAAIDTSDWVDPHDLSNYDPVTKTMRKVKQDSESTDYASVPVKAKDHMEEHSIVSHDLANEKCCQELFTCNQQQKKSSQKNECVRASFDDSFMKRHVARLIKQMGLEGYIPTATQTIEVHLLARLSADELKILSTFVETGTHSSMHAADAVLSRFLFRTDPLPAPNKWLQGFSDSISFVKNVGIQTWLIMLTAFSVIVVLNMILRGYPLIYIISVFLILLFIISFFWHWMQMYQALIAKRHAHLMHQQEIPTECRVEKMSWYSQTWEWLRTTVFFGENRCEKYYMSVMVDPIWDVSPTQVLAETVTKFFVHPARDTGAAFAMFYREIFHHLGPIYGALGAVISVLLFIGLFLMLFGYELHLPFFMGSLRQGRAPRPLRGEVVRELIQEMRNQPVEGAAPTAAVATSSQPSQVIHNYFFPRDDTMTTVLPHLLGNSRIQKTDVEKIKTPEHTDKLSAEGQEMEVCEKPVDSKLPERTAENASEFTHLHKIKAGGDHCDINSSEAQSLLAEEARKLEDRNEVFLGRVEDALKADEAPDVKEKRKDCGDHSSCEEVQRDLAVRSCKMSDAGNKT